MKNPPCVFFRALAMAALALPATLFAREPNEPQGIGLVLGGGGALGFAHIGVLRVLEENRIPISYIAGTSMGSIIGGLYAAGMSPDEMEAFLARLDWDEVMSDATPRRDLYFRMKRDDQRYLFGMGLNFDGPKMGTGFAAGQKFNNLMRYVTLRVEGIEDFDQLPIPYRAVATDLVSGKAHILSSGVLQKAMRASMAVPGVFTAVEIDGHLLVDGGVVMNMPVDVARGMGAKVVIAVDVCSNDDTVDPAALNSMGGVLGRTYIIAQRPDQIRAYDSADIGIRPDLPGLSAADFHRVAEFIAPGEAAARAQAEKLKAYSLSEGDYARWLAKQRRPQPAAAKITSVTVSGTGRVNPKIVEKRIFSAPGETISEKKLWNDLMRVYGIGEFEQVLFSMDPEGKLDFNVTEKAWGPLYLSFGMRMQTDFESDDEWAMLLNLTRRSLNPLGAEWRNDFEFGSLLKAESEFYQPLDARGVFFVAPKLGYHEQTENVYLEGTHVADYRVRRTEGHMDFGVQFRKYAEFRVGPFWGQGKADIEVGDPALPDFDENYAGFGTRLSLDRLDRTLFAREGSFAQIEGLFNREELGSDRDFDKLSVLLLKHQSFGEHTFTTTVNAGDALGSDLPGYAQFTLGGPESFAGLASGQFRGSSLGVASLGHRYRIKELPPQLGRGLYTLLRFDAGNVWESDADYGDLRYGGMMGLAADTAFGPLYLVYGQADGGYSGVYLSLGTSF
jgi:NTE family protein